MIVLSAQTPRARKQHACDSCGKAIEPGTVYTKQFVTDGGDSWTWKAHSHCVRAGEILFKNGFDDYGGLVSVTDMEHEDRQLIYAEEPETFFAVWPNRPAP